LGDGNFGNWIPLQRRSGKRQALLQRQMRFAALAVVENLSLSASIAVAVAMAAHGYGYRALVGMNEGLPANHHTNG